MTTREYIDGAAEALNELGVAGHGIVPFVGTAPESSSYALLLQDLLTLAGMGIALGAKVYTAVCPNHEPDLAELERLNTLLHEVMQVMFRAMDDVGDVAVPA